MPSGKTRKNAPLAAVLNLLFCLGGLGYLYLGQVRKGIVVIGLLLVLHTINALGGAWGVEWMERTLFPLAFSFQILTAVDALLLARHLSAGGAMGPWSTLVPALRLGVLKRDPLGSVPEP